MLAAQNKNHIAVKAGILFNNPLHSIILRDPLPI
jgi:hypothetical protein